MKRQHAFFALSVGIAIFSMFFGAGNVVFPLLLGEQTGNQIGMALLGVSLTAVGAPLLGLFGCVLYQGDCKAFFYRIGAFPGLILVVLLMALLGPIGVMPRCFIVAYSAMESNFPNLPLSTFSIISGVIALLLIAKRNWVLPLLGKFLSPILILLLALIVGIGLYNLPELARSDFTPWGAFQTGLVSGYYMMDLLAALFFAISIWILLKEKWHTELSDHTKDPVLMRIYVIASLIGGACLAFAYIGLGVCAAGAQTVIQEAPPEQALSALAIHILGPGLAIAANSVIALACLTTVMSLAVAIGDVIHSEMEDTPLGERLRYRYDVMMVIIIGVTVAFTNMGFSKIMGFLGPIVTAVYPAIIVLTICNILHKLYGFKSIKLPFYAVLLITLLFQVMPVSAAPQLLEFVVEGTEDAPVLSPDTLALKLDQEYVIVLQNPFENPLMLQYGALGQSVSTQYLQGTGNLSQTGLMLLPETQLVWHFYTKTPGIFDWGISNNSSQPEHKPGKIVIAALPTPEAIETLQNVQTEEPEKGKTKKKQKSKEEKAAQKETKSDKHAKKSLESYTTSKKQLAKQKQAEKNTSRLK